MILLAFLFSLFVAANGAPAPAADTLLDLFPFPFPWCASTTTITLGGTYTVTSTSTVTSATKIVTVTAPPHLSISTVKTTTYSPTDLSCIRTATTITPYPKPFITLAPRADPPAIGDCPPITIVPPTITGEPCTCITGDFAITTDTVTVTTSGVSTTTTTPTKVITETQTWVLPTPTAYKGVNYYQYLNDYVYPYGAGGCANCGFGGGGYETSDWNGNLSYYTSGTTQNINFESQGYLNWNTILCQLPGQAAPTNCGQWTVVFQGFLHATQTGTYTIAPDLGEDNAVFFWAGEKAYTSYANGNVDGGVSYTQPSGVPHSFGYNLVAGEFLPITFIYVNGYGPAKNQVTITGPDGISYPQDLDLFVPPCPNSPFVP